MAKVKIYNNNNTKNATHNTPATKQHKSFVVLSDGNTIVASPDRPMNWKEAAAWVVKAHSGAWKRLED
jgi:hypothetical protein